MRHSSRTFPHALLQPAASLLALLALGAGAATLFTAPRSSAQPPGSPDPAAIAEQLPPLPAEDGRVELPLAGRSPFPWMAIGGGGIDHPEARLEARYGIAAGVPAGAALIVRPGTLAGLKALEIEIRGERTTQLVPTLRDTAGVVYRFPSVPVQAGGPRSHRLSVDELSYFPGQAAAPDPGSFDPAGAILLSLVDISGFIGTVPDGTEIAWTVSRLTAVLAPAEAAAEIPPPAARSTAGPAPGTERTPGAERAESRFFEALNHRPDRPAAPLADLMAAFAADPRDARTNLWLGLDHLWLAAEGDRTDPRAIEHLILAEHFLARTQELDSSDRRLASWLVPTRRALARLDGDRERSRALEAELLAAYRRDPDFHAVAVAMAGFGAPRGTAAFTRGLEALRASRAGCTEAEPTCTNRPRWPHNVESFLTFGADYELKAGEKHTARGLLEQVRARPGYDRWPYRGEVEDRLEHLDLLAELYANSDPTDDPPALVSGRRTCQACHRAG